MQVGPFQILIVALVLLVLFGRGRISGLMGDFGKGVKSFRRNIADGEARSGALESAGLEADAVTEPNPAPDQSL